MKVNRDAVKAKVIEHLTHIYDPEIPLNIYALGLIYDIGFGEKKEGLVCFIEMTLTSAACPVAESLVDQVRNVSYVVDEVEAVELDIVFDPPWTQDSISYEGKLELGLL